MEKRGSMLQEIEAHELNVNCLSIGKKSNRVFLTGGEDRKVNFWSIGQTSPSLSLQGHTSGVESVAFDSAEALVLAGASNGTIKLWDLEEGKMRSLTGHQSSCTVVEFHPFGELFASGSVDTDLKIWDIKMKGCIQTYTGHSRAIKTVRFTPDGRWVVTGGDDNMVKVWDLTAGKLMHEFKYHSGSINCLNFHPHEFLLATGSGDRTVKFWDLETFEIIGSTGLEASGMRAMVFHPDGRTVFCGTDNALKVYSWEPVRCHDVVEIGWTNLADFTIYEGKLLALSLHQSRVALWLADISLIAPYALGVVPTTDIPEPVVIPTYTHTRLQEELVKVKPPLFRPKTPKESSSLSSGSMETEKMRLMSPDRSSKKDLNSTVKISKQSSTTKVSKISSSSPVVRSKLGGSSSSSSSSLVVTNNNNNNSKSSGVKKKVKKREESPPVKDIHEISTSFSVPLVVPREEERYVSKDPELVKSKKGGGVLELDNISEKESIIPCLVSFNKAISLDDTCEEAPSPCSTSDTEGKVKYVRGVAVPLGKTKSLVQKWEKRDDNGPPEPQPPSLSVSKIPTYEKEEQLQLAVIDEDSLICDSMLQNHDFFINSLKSRLTKLQVVRHFFEKDGIKGSIDAVAKLPDHSVQVDLASVLKEKIQAFNLELFACFLPILVGLLSSKTERHMIVSMGMTIDLIKMFGAIIHSTLSATSRVGVDIQAEQRLKRCKSCFNHLQKMPPHLQPLTQKGGEIGKLALILSLSLQNLQH